MPTEAVRSTPDFRRQVHCLLGLPIDAVNLAAAEGRIRTAAAQRSPCFLSTPNVNFLIACRSDAEFRNSVIDSDLSIADGMPLVWLGRLVGIPLRERVAGAALFDALRYRPGERLSVYLFGGPDGVAELASRKLSLEGRGLTCVGYESPGFGSIEAMSGEDTIRRINAARPDVLVVSLGARKGQAWIERNRKRLNVPVISHLGVVLHFAAGTVRRAPAWMQRCGLEWLWRIKEQPGLWRRYYADGLALAELLVTRVLPYAWYLRRHRADAERLAAARAETRDEGQTYAVRLHGAWTQSNSTRLRRCFYHAALAGKDVRLETSGVTYVDSAFIGLVMLLHSHQRQHGRRLLLPSIPPAVRRVFGYCCADFLLSDAAPARELPIGIQDAVLSDDVRP